MAQNMSEKFVQDCSTAYNFDYTEIVYFSSIVSIVTALYYVFYCCYYYASFPSCSIAFLVIYVQLTGRYLGELPVTTAFFTFVISLCKYFEKEGLCLVWCLKPHLAIFHEKYTKILLNDEASIDKTLFYDLVSDMLGKSLLTLNGSEWKRCKKTLSPLFRFEKLKDTEAILNKNSEDIVKKIASEGNSSTINVLPLLKMGILKAFCEAMLDVKIKDEDDAKLSQYIQTVSSSGALTMDRLTRPWLWWRHSLLFFNKGRSLLKLYGEYRDFAKLMIQRMMPNSAIQQAKIDDGRIDKKNVLYSIFKEKLTKDPTFTMRDAEDAVNILLFAGHDTTSYTVLWCIFLLGLHPEIQEKALEEIDLVTSQSTDYIRYRDLKELKYLECIIKETLRLYPVVPFFGRVTRKDITFGKYVLPKNTDVYIIPYLLHRNPDSYSNPEEFDPERFNGKDLKHPWAYIPFAEGMRSCVGKAFAMMEMKIMLAHILKNFKVTSLDKREDIWLDVKIVLTPLTPIRLQFTRRKNILSPDA